MRAMEALLDRGNLLHVLLAVVLLVSGLACALLGVRDGFVRRSMRTSGGLLTGGKAVAAGVLYVGTGLAGAIPAILFLLRPR
jgi:hypothetical protein